MDVRRLRPVLRKLPLQRNGLIDSNKGVLVKTKGGLTMGEIGQRHGKGLIEDIGLLLRKRSVQGNRLLYRPKGILTMFTAALPLANGEVGQVSGKVCIVDMRLVCCKLPPKFDSAFDVC